MDAFLLLLGDGTSGKTKAERKGKGIVKPLWIEIA
jgi:hypothetical protein